MKNLKSLRLDLIVDAELYAKTLRLKKILFKVTAYLAPIVFLFTFFKISLGAIYACLSLAVLLEIISFLIYEGRLDKALFKLLQKKRRLII